VGVAVAAGGVASAIAVQRRHLRRIADDPRYAELRRRLEGESLTVTSADGTRLHATASPPAHAQAAAAVTFVLIHGWTEDQRLWGPVIRALDQRGFRTVAYDLRGHGQSERAAGDDYDLERFGEDVEAVLAAVVPDGQRAIPVGHSMGAMSIAAWAEHHEVRRRARAAVLTNTGLGDLLTGHVLLGDLAARYNNETLGRLFMSSRAPLPGFSSPIGHVVLRHMAFGPSAGAAEVALFERMLLSCPPHVRSACGVAMSNMDLHHAVERIDVPTLVVAGDRDRLTPAAHARRIAEALPDSAGLVELENTGHMGPLERPHELAELLAGLAERTASADDRAEPGGQVATGGLAE
jgi:pimeloyl-ACP methyl ester carboxylesterase